ncbi:MAG TPA: hypothetical protein VM577_02460, partial [Anaerovoracaceae bacterium]|nr:hypothetical protein [Anaerovoracaceae bacterium]
LKEIDSNAFKLISEHHSKKPISYKENDYGTSFESEYDDWLEVYTDLLNENNVKTIEGIEVDVLIALHNQGYISNCWVWNRHYFATKYDFYAIQNNAPTRLIEDGLHAITTEQLVEKCKETGLVEELIEGIYLPKNLK